MVILMCIGYIVCELIDLFVSSVILVYCWLCSRGLTHFSWDRMSDIAGDVAASDHRDYRKEIKNNK
jgi:hypothetical protein